MAGDIAFIIIPTIVIASIMLLLVPIQEKRRQSKFRARLAEIDKRRLEREKVLEKELKEIQFIQRLEERGF